MANNLIPVLSFYASFSMNMDTLSYYQISAKIFRNYIKTTKSSFAQEFLHKNTASLFLQYCNLLSSITILFSSLLRSILRSEFGCVVRANGYLTNMINLLSIVK